MVTHSGIRGAAYHAQYPQQEAQSIVFYSASSCAMIVSTKQKHRIHQQGLVSNPSSVIEDLD